jgi:hypothetical protein
MELTEAERIELIRSVLPPAEADTMCDGPGAFDSPSKEEQVLDFIHGFSTNSRIADKVRSKEPLLPSEQKFLAEVFALFGME